MSRHAWVVASAMILASACTPEVPETRDASDNGARDRARVTESTEDPAGSAAGSRGAAKQRGTRGLDVVRTGYIVRGEPRRTLAREYRSGAASEVSVRVEMRDDDERVFVYDVRLVGSGEGSRITDYAYAAGPDPPHRWVDVRTGSALAPELPRSAWLPSAFTRGTDDEATITFLGMELQRTDAAVEEIAWSTPVDLSVDPGHLIGTSRDFRDDGTGRHGKDWRWVPLQPEDYARMIDAGFNLFRFRRRDWPVLRQQPVFLVSDAVGLGPALPLHPTYRGAVMYADEPVIRARRDEAFRSIDTPAAAADEVMRRTSNTLEGSDRYGRGFLQECLREHSLDWGAVSPTEYPVWEAVPSAAWYELAAGADGWCFECRLDPDVFARNVERALDVRFPATVEACIDFHLALFRGASRYHDAPWGVAAYGQSSDAVLDALFPRAYAQGARYLWLWTSDGDHHIPFERQLELARTFRAGDPRSDRPDGPPSSVALVLPWGYTFGDDTFRPRRGGPFVWGIPGLPFDATNGAGVTHRVVLRTAMNAVIEMLEDGIGWDTLFLREGETVDGYERVLRVTAAGKIVESVR